MHSSRHRHHRRHYFGHEAGLTVPVSLVLPDTGGGNEYEAPILELPRLDMDIDIDIPAPGPATSDGHEVNVIVFVISLVVTLVIVFVTVTVLGPVFGGN